MNRSLAPERTSASHVTLSSHHTRSRSLGLPSPLWTGFGSHLSHPGCLTCSWLLFLQTRTSGSSRSMCSCAHVFVWWLCTSDFCRTGSPRGERRHGFEIHPDHHTRPPPFPRKVRLVPPLPDPHDPGGNGSWGNEERAPPPNGHLKRGHWRLVEGGHLSAEFGWESGTGPGLRKHAPMAEGRKRPTGGKNVKCNEGRFGRKRPHARFSPDECAGETDALDRSTIPREHRCKGVNRRISVQPSISITAMERSSNTYARMCYLRPGSTGVKQTRNKPSPFKTLGQF